MEMTLIEPHCCTATQVSADPRHHDVRPLHSAEAEKELLQLVQSDVRQFILSKTTAEETIRAYKTEVFSHPLTDVIFRKIVKDARKKQFALCKERQGRRKRDEIGTQQNLKYEVGYD